MLERAKVIFSNTTPLIALKAPLGSLDVLQFLYARVVVPFDVAQEVRAGGAFSVGVDAFESDICCCLLSFKDGPKTH
jgi:hypothetical protein